MYANYNPLFGFVNPLVYKNYETHLKREFAEDYSIQKFFESSEKFYGLIRGKYKTIAQTKPVLVDDYLQLMKNIFAQNRTETAKIFSLLIKNQDEFVNDFLVLINTLNSIISDKTKTSQIIDKESDTIKKTYLLTIIDIQKKLLVQLKKELEKSKNIRFGILSKVPILNAFLLSYRLRFLKKIERPIAAMNILVLRLTNSFDKDKMKTEINQAYEEFAKAGILESSRNYDNYNKYIGQIIKA